MIIKIMFINIINSIYTLNLVNYWFKTARESWLFEKTIFKKKS